MWTSPSYFKHWIIVYLVKVITFGCYFRLVLLMKMGYLHQTQAQNWLERMFSLMPMILVSMLSDCGYIIWSSGMSRMSAAFNIWVFKRNNLSILKATFWFKPHYNQRSGCRDITFVSKALWYRTFKNYTAQWFEIFLECTKAFTLQTVQSSCKNEWLIFW